jgi:hypothetical protein
MGQLVLSQKAEEETRFDIRPFGKGVYYLRLSGPQQPEQWLKLLVQ